MHQVLTPEEIAALLEGLQEAEADLSDRRAAVSKAGPETGCILIAGPYPNTDNDVNGG
jgi:hypothetical protein